MQAVRLLQAMGYWRVSHYAGGIRDWRQAGYPFDVGEERSVSPEDRLHAPEGRVPPA